MFINIKILAIEEIFLLRSVDNVICSVVGILKVHNPYKVHAYVGLADLF